jgi:hypothetical protein
MVNLKLGTGQAIYSANSGGLDVVLDFGRSIQRGGNLYIVWSLDFAFVDQTVVTDDSRLQSFFTSVAIPIGLQYDLPLFIPGLFLTPRLQVGYLFNSQRTTGLTSLGPVDTALGVNSAVLLPEIGLKWILRKRLNFGADLLSVPISLSQNSIGVSYRVLFYVGVNL